MDQYIESKKLVTYLTQTSSGSFLELTAEAIKSSSSSPSISAQQDSSLIDFCTYHSLCPQLVKLNPSSSISSQTPSIHSQDLNICVPSIPPIDDQNQSSDTSASSPTLSEKNDRTKGNLDVPTSSMNSKSNHSSPMNHIVRENSLLDQCVSSSNKQPRHLSASQRNKCHRISDYELSDFIIRVEQLSSPWILDNVTPRTTADNKKSLPTTPVSERTSTKLPHILLPPSISIETQLSSATPSNRRSTTENSTANTNENPNRRSPKYRPRHCYLYSTETELIAANNAKVNPEDDLLKSSTASRQTCRSPVFIRRPQQRLTDRNVDSTDSSRETMALFSLDTNGSISPVPDEIDNHPLDKRQVINSLALPPSSNKRPIESSASEQILIKRRHPKSVPTTIIQRHFCISYPTNIQRCVDCRAVNSLDLSIQQTGCRFQHCRTLKYLADNQYEVEGFTTADKAQFEDIEYLLTPNSGGQPAMNSLNANYILSQLGRWFCLLFSQEDHERSIQKEEQQVIWRRYMAGWREVCDDCFTTLFNYHYMCKHCGHMICIECSNEFSQTNTEKRKKSKQSCSHENSYCLSEFIPWKILIKLRANCIDYLSKLQINCSIKLYQTARNENLSTFIKSLKMKRSADIDDVQKIWSTMDCNLDGSIEFYCRGRLPVFNKWVSENARQFFQTVWSASCPVLVKHVHRNLSKTLWHPDAFKIHMIDYRETPALWDCETLTPIPTDEHILTRFWDGFERLNVRLRDDEHGGRTRILKLKDWPTKKDFASVFPACLHDLMNNIPFSDYTRRSYSYNGVTYPGGVFNIVERLPACLVKPDLGPKLYIAYSQLRSQTSKKAGTTNLHIDVSDAVNVLVYVGIGGHGEDGADKEEEIKQVEAEIHESNIDEAQLQRLRNGERPGAIWHLFRSDDVKKLREYMSRTQRKVSGSDCIHDQTSYLEKDDLNKLKECSQVESYPIIQFLGDAIFVPSGTPHQVKNLHSCIKIAEDFVSPENLDRCLITANEFRSLSKTHTNHADILQAKNILYYATRDSLHSLTESNSDEVPFHPSTFDALS